MPRHTLSLLLLLALTLPGRGAVTSFPASPVDWLEIGAGGTALFDDNGAPAGSVQLTVHNGLLVPGSPRAGVLQSSFWMAAPPVMDSQRGDQAIPNFEIRLLPSNGAADYELQITLTGQFDVLVAIGQLFSDAVDATDRISLSASSSHGPRTPEFLGAFGWDNGLVPYDQSLDWTPGANLLSPAAGALGESQVALFRINGAERTTITLPSAYARNSGDSVLFAVALVPEPASALLLLGAAPLLLLRRRRRRWSP